MKKFIPAIMAVVMCILFVSCGEKKREETITKEIDTGIPDVVMMIEDNLTEDKINNYGDNRVQYINGDGKDVEYRRWDTDGNTEMEKYRSYHSDGRLYQELVKYYENGELYLTDLSQYVYTENSREAVVTIWQNRHKRGELETDSVICTMTTEESELYCNSFQATPWKIRGMDEYRYGMRLGHIEFMAGMQIEN